MTNHAATIPGAAEILPAERPTFRAWYALFILIIAALFGAVDRQILVLVTEPIKQDMQLADVQIGVLQGLGPGLFAALGGVALGWLVDRGPRQIIFAACVLAWAAATAACGLADTFGELFAATIAIALGEAVLAPVIYSMVPDMFPGKSRITANFIVFGATTIGAGFGIALGGGAIAWIDAHRVLLPESIQSWAAWRLAFLAVAAPGVPIALAVLAIGPVKRIVNHAVPQAMVSIKSYVREHWPALLGLYTAASLYGIAQYAAYAWAPVYIMRILGASPADVGVGVGAASTIGSVAGVCFAAVVTKLLRPRFGVMAPLRLYLAAMAATLIPVVLQLAVQHPWQAYVLIGIQTATGIAGASLMPTLLQDISPALIRGRVIALGTAFFVVSIAGAPVLVGFVSDALEGDPRGLLWALVLVSTPAIAAGVLLLKLADGAFRRTVEAFAPDAPAAQVVA